MSVLLSANRIQSTKSLINMLKYSRVDEGPRNLNSGAMRVIQMVCDGDHHIYQKGINAQSARDLMTISDLQLYSIFHKEKEGDKDGIY